MKQYIEELPKETTDEAFSLTKELYLRQQQATPVTLNSLIAAVLLYETSDSMKMSDLLARTTLIYEYVKIKKNTTTYMAVKP